MRAQQASRLSNTPSPLANSGLTALILVSSGVAWLATAQLATTDMQIGPLTTPLVAVSMDQLADQTAAMGMMTLPPLGPFVGMWATMMAAMMLPSLWPAARAIDATRRAMRRTFVVTLLFVAGYLLVWSAVGSVAYVAMGLLQDILPAGSVASLRGGAVLLLIAGAYQFTPFKQACLRRRHAPCAMRQLAV